MPKHQVKKFRRNGNSVKKPLHWLWGEQSVLETLQLGHWRVYELFVSAEIAGQHAELIRSKQSEGIEVHVVPSAQLDELTQKAEHQGIIARVSIYPCLPIDELELVTQREHDKRFNRNPLLVAVDRIQDPSHFAAILRCCKEAGVCGVLMGEHCQTQVTTQIARASLGAVNHFPIFQSADLLFAIQKAKALGFSAVACTAQSSGTFDNVAMLKPIVLLVGSETQGIAQELLEICDEQVSLKMFGASVALPAIVQAGIMLYEIRRLQNSPQP